MIEYPLKLWWRSARSYVVNQLRYFSFQQVLHNWCNKSQLMYYPDYEMMLIKDEKLLLKVQVIVQ